MKKRIILPIIAVIAAVILFGGCFYTTQPNEYTIVRQFGAVVKVVDEPGLSMKLPFIQSVSTLPKTEMLYDLAVSDVITSDKKSMVADSFVLWRIRRSVCCLSRPSPATSRTPSTVSTPLSITASRPSSAP